MSNYKILIVDDDSDCRRLVSTVLKASNYEVAEAANGQEAVDFLKNQTVDLVVLDVMMPVMNGHEVAKWIKGNQSTANTSIVMLTAKSESEDIMEGYSEYQVDYYITKPFTPRQLIAGINLVLGEEEQ